MTDVVGPNAEIFNFIFFLPVRWVARSETWFKTFCILIRPQTFGPRLKFETLVSAKDKVTCTSAGTSYGPVSVCVCLSVCHKSVFC